MTLRKFTRWLEDRDDKERQEREQSQSIGNLILAVAAVIWVMFILHWEPLWLLDSLVKGGWIG